MFVAASLCAALAACAPPSDPTESLAEPTATDAVAFLDEVERQLTAIGEESARINWVNATYINYDTDWLVSNIDARVTELGVNTRKRRPTFDGVDVPADARRKLERLKLDLSCRRRIARCRARVR